MNLKYFNKRLKQLKSFIKKYNRLPKRNSIDESEVNLYRWMTEFKYEFSEIKELISQVKPHRERSPRSKCDPIEMIQQLDEYVTKFNQLPSRTGETKILSKWVWNHCKHPAVIPYIEKYRNNARYMDRTEELHVFCEMHNRLPHGNEARSLGDWVLNNKDRLPEVHEIYSRYIQPNILFIRLREWINEHGRLPKSQGKYYKGDTSKIDLNERRNYDVMINHRNHPEIKELIAKYNK